MSAHSVFYKKLQSKNSLFYMLCICCIGYVAVSVFFSQKYNEHMYGLMQGDSVSTISYLKHIWGTPLFDMEVETYKDEGRSDILSQWVDVQKKNTKRIQTLEDAVKIYPYSAELYYNLHLLYLENGNVIKAKESLTRAQEIDPSIQ